MTTLLEHAFAKAATLPRDEQEVLASRLLAELVDFPCFVGLPMPSVRTALQEPGVPVSRARLPDTISAGRPHAFVA